jgi:DNA-binding MarR family transcriptional regulator
VLNQLVNDGFIIVKTGTDKRTKKLSLTDTGQKLEKELSIIQIKKIKKVINNFSEENINSFKKILYEMIDSENKKTFKQLNDSR